MRDLTFSPKEPHWELALSKYFDFSELPPLDQINEANIEAVRAGYDKYKEKFNELFKIGNKFEANDVKLFRKRKSEIS